MSERSTTEILKGVFEHSLDINPISTCKIFGKNENRTFLVLLSLFELVNIFQKSWYLSTDFSQAQYFSGTFLRSQRELISTFFSLELYNKIKTLKRSIVITFLGAQASELEPLVGGHTMDTIDGVVLEGDEHEESLPDLKVTFRSET